MWKLRRRMGRDLDKKSRHVSFPGIEEMESLEDTYYVCHVVLTVRQREEEDFWKEEAQTTTCTHR